LQAVDVIHKDTLHAVDLGIDVSWNSDVHEEERPVLA